MQLIKTFLLISTAVVTTFAFVVLLFKIFYPHHRSISFGLIFINLLVLNVFLVNESTSIPSLSELSMLVYLSLGIFLCFYLVYSILPFDEITFSKQSNRHLKRKISSDSQRLKKLMLLAERDLEGFSKDELLQMTIHEGDPESVEELKKKWAEFLVYIGILNGFISEYKYFYRNDIRSYKLSTRAFFIGYNAFLTKYRIVFVLAKKLSPYAEGILNEADGRGEEQTFHRLKMNLVHPRTVLYFLLGEVYIHLLSWFQDYLKKKMRLPKESLALTEHPRKLWKVALVNLWHFIKVSMTVTLDDFEKTTHSKFFPFQKKLIHFLGERRLTRRKNFFISRDQIKKIKTLLEPGDIFVQRKDWELSNFGMRGFWKHAGVYTGTLDDLDHYFRSESQLLFKMSFSRYLKKRFPKVYFHKIIYPNSPATIEVRAKGTVMLPLEELAKADHLAILRPRLSKMDKLKALLFAFESYGKSYDYNFDFSDNQNLICSELVYKAYLPSKSKKGLRYKLRQPQGRYIMTPNDIVQSFDLTHETEDSQVDFIYFLSANGPSKKAVFKSLEDFRKSWKKGEMRYIKEIFFK